MMRTVLITGMLILTTLAMTAPTATAWNGTCLEWDTGYDSCVGRTNASGFCAVTVENRGSYDGFGCVQVAPRPKACVFAHDGDESVCAFV